jgi:hypothetical protein
LSNAAVLASHTPGSQHRAVLQPQPKSHFAESLSGLIERVTFFNEESGFTVLKVK